MRIGLTCTTIEPSITNGHIDGIGTYTKNLYDAFNTKKEQVFPYSFANQKGLKSSFSNGNFFPFSYSFSTVSSFLTPAKFNLNGRFKNKIDLLHVTDHMLPKISDVPIIATICDGLMFNNNNWHWNKIKLANIKKWLRKKTIHWADHFITISNAMVPELVNYIGIKEENISVVHLGIQKDWFIKKSEENKNLVLKKFNLPNNFLLFTGTLQQKKNLPRIINAYLELPTDIQDNYPLVIVGRNGWGSEESLASIKKLTDRKKGVWLKYINIEELKVLFQCASLYVHPSLHEGFGLTLLEAFASETPTLTSNVTALPEVANGAAYLVDPYSVDAIKNGIQNILTSTNLQKDLVQKGIIRAQEFSWKKCAEETLKIYKRVL
ncbi:glycosyltransferase family 4 protein [Gammaproteobacteria bacterium]|nr:glycosyltransferase family 4 protein [Gammaproteobacteria bacterium]